MEMNQGKRKVLSGEVQKILAEDLPYLPLWFNDVVSVHRRSLGALDLPSTGNYNFLATLKPAGNKIASTVSRGRVRLCPSAFSISATGIAPSRPIL